MYDLEHTKPAYEGVCWDEWISEAKVSVQDFNNNDKLLKNGSLVENSGTDYYKLTSRGRENVLDYRKRRKRANDYEALCNLEEVTPQQRGHRLEDLLADSAEWENWKVQRRVRAQGTENDIIMNTGLDYFLSSCKWECEPVRADVIEGLESRVRSRAQTKGGILFSMSGFTPNAIVEIRNKIATALIILFGPADIAKIMNNETTMTNLLDEKIKQIMHHRKILVDGEIK